MIYTVIDWNIYKSQEEYHEYYMSELRRFEDYYKFWVREEIQKCQQQQD